MKQFFLYLLAGSMIFGLGCGEGSEQNANEAMEAQADMAETEAAVATNRKDAAICLWSKVGLRDAAGMGNGVNYLTTIYFGESVIPTGETEEKDDNTYLKVRLSNGDEGWVKESLLALGAEAQIATADIDVYPRPDLMTYKGEKFKRGEVVAISSNTEGDWIEVFGLEKKPKGWIREVGNLSDNELDVTVGVLYNRAMQESDKKKRISALSNIASNSTFSASSLMSLVDETLAESAEAPRAELPANQAYIEATVLNVRSEPDTEQENVLFQVKEGDVVEILERGDRVELNGMDDYWYLIRAGGQEGWIYGAHTSKKL